MGKLTMYSLLCVLFILVGCKNDDNADSNSYQEGIQFFEMTWEERARSYQVYYPQEEHSEKTLPVLFVIHGGGSDATDMQTITYSRFNELADLHGFLVVYPEGFEKQWNDGREVEGIVTAWDENIDDVGFISEIVRELRNEFTLDDNRIFTTGISNGGFMSSRLLCDRSDLFRGGAIVTATLGEDYIGNCNPTNSNAVLVLNGTDDTLVPYEGGQVMVLGQERGLVLSTDAYMEFWASHNGCDTSPTITDLPDNEDDGTTIQIYDYNSCGGQNVVQLYRIEGGGHTWPGGVQYLPVALVGRTTQEIVACDVIWEFFSGL